MSKEVVLERIGQLGVIAVIRGPSETLTLKMVEALVAGSITAIEITYSTPNAESVVAALARRFGDEVLLGMGTLTSPHQAAAAVPAVVQQPVGEVAVQRGPAVPAASQLDKRQPRRCACT